ncbi:TPM domain-containing protein [Caldimonas thermodepolymerans]|jgi:Beta-propeller domains of methanol dehydrogenase type|uniref:Uncharacterized protein n=1 Tax=Caldimonas thermodepolymerans TaxID=215580 RepID=A0A2S5T7S3_9BURK|nr:TPM domain-containing protein [Caldimonas thermodepolymerans]PPE70972.1 hypothetical protein C1702_03135 [Caldimonas thermodepolymerans]QPC31271.1 TPM domain-containing protein [Caldimonas thermodepolymerans]RDH99765.1 uncharacterized protein DES46_105247 [Caldimonas thermodepolymerans]
MKGVLRALWGRLLPALGLALWLGTAGAQDVLPVPELTARVIDQTGTLSQADRARLEAQLEAVETTHGSQIVVLMVPTTQPEDIAAYAWRVADTWKIGRKEVGDGVLLVIAKNDRRIRIEVARALEGAIPDLAARRIIDRAMTPAFRRDDFAGGISAAIDQLAALIAGEGLPEPGKRGARGDDGIQVEDLVVLLFVGTPIIGTMLTGIFGRRLGAVATGGALGALGWFSTASLAFGLVTAVLVVILVLVLGIGVRPRPGQGLGTRHRTPIIWGGGGGGGFGGGFGGGGGGFSSGGGGGFGGGGASGGW